MQVTISNPVSCYGIGVHSGERTQLTLKPAKENTGIVFVRTDVPSNMNFLSASYLNVHDTFLSTSIKNSYNVGISTIEHLMAALWGCGIDNVLVELDGPEVPIMDGSSKPFVFMIECAGKRLQNAPKKFLKLLKEVSVEADGAEIIATPANIFTLNFTIDYKNKAIGHQNLSYSSQTNFINDLASARTFGFVHELDYLKARGLAKGASLDNAIGIEQDIILNHDGLRYRDEFVRHKTLDQVGDLYTCGANFIGTVTSYKAGHTLNNHFLRTLFSDSTAYEFVSSV